ncbi:MAG: 3-oxoacyl-ACP synthase [Flavobacteriales bacterium]|nr:3-oxoacyl-ACP synthase [Flavobacteriia bacterium]NCP06253.1 3-oxoacyl-ACP synthase [Flavobacteriales bacterium]PIV94626.1 MAG: 3-oxoacyl-ACP synthase [Flavobacteriaceae bacterium CG17_big_fil_post_rev_8_21_14_2_50_33_15]PIY12371.1 MAG: 3-oxoacyl-ACP synthase [Flavobacteriaceae bacterium CG_4_10_14_3_um_filter_33_47]PJB19465.1 MAG: 3-oxoacyl-ACP synthase [Flavobacteriaceae bacterium CG_4_9_14_3_um_filter_33_16]
MTNNLDLKKQLYNQCFDFIENRFITIKNSINDIQEALNSETKNSSGDKHETGRAMLQIDLEKAGNQLNEILKIKDILKKVDITKRSDTVRLGSVVYTSKFNYFIAISAGSLLFEDQNFYAIATDTPIGQLLATKHAGDQIVFRDENIRIEAVF